MHKDFFDKLISFENHVTDFLIGGYGIFDGYATDVVRKGKGQYRPLRLFMPQYIRCSDGGIYVAMRYRKGRKGKRINLGKLKE